MPDDLHEPDRTGGVVDLRRDHGPIGGITVADVGRDVDDRHLEAGGGGGHGVHGDTESP